MIPELIGVAWVVATVFALLVALPALRDVAVDGLEHHRRMRARGDDAGDATVDDAVAEPAAERERVACRHCGAENDPRYRYCRRCSRRR